MSLFVPPLAARKGSSLYNDIKNLGLLTNLKLCHDYGDANCYPGSGQSVFDLAGVSSPFYLGSGSGSDAADPAFNGVAGRMSSAEYLSSDGGDLLTYSAANETWMKSFFKQGANSYWAVVYVPSSADFYLFSTETNGDPSKFGGSYGYKSSSKTMTFVYASGTGTFFTVFNNGPDLTVTPGFPNIIGSGAAFSIDGSGNWLKSRINANDALDSSGSGTVPDSGDPVATARILGNTAVAAPSGLRLYELALWQGTKLSLANLQAIYDLRRGRYGLL